MRFFKVWCQRSILPCVCGWHALGARGMIGQGFWAAALVAIDPAIEGG
jgi:hypothetical protein